MLKSLLTPEFISGLLATFGVLSVIWYRFKKLKDASDILQKALKLIVDAGVDNKVTEAEYQAIIIAIKELVPALKAIVAKKPADVPA